MRPKRWALVVALAVGLGLAAAPAVFQLFTRAPAGGRMIDSFQPIMTQAKVTEFRRYMAEIGRGEAEAAGPLTAATGRGGADFARRYPSAAAFERAWPGIDADMGNMLSTMQRDLPNYQAVRALPPFWMFPWFFVLPGLMIAAAAVWALARTATPSARKGALVLAALGVAVVAAPAVFQMFTRAPRGAQMISDFKPLMTPARVTRVQGYFLTIGAAEGELRTQALPAVAAGGSTSPSFPAVSQWSRDWPHISSEMAPMIGAMSDNLANFGDVAALPPFWMFPWFFVLPGVIVFGMALTARAGTSAARAVGDGLAPAEQLTVEASRV